MAKNSDPPNGIKIYLPPKMAIIVIAILLGSGVGGIGISNMLNGKKSENVTTERQEFNVRFERIETGQKSNTKKIEKLDEQVGEIQAVQHSDIARTEARRLTEKIANRAKREKEYDLLVSRNLDRLKKGLAPCQTVKCGE